MNDKTSEVNDFIKNTIKLGKTSVILIFVFVMSSMINMIEELSSFDYTARHFVFISIDVIIILFFIILLVMIKINFKSIIPIETYPITEKHDETEFDKAINHAYALLRKFTTYFSYLILGLILLVIFGLILDYIDINESVAFVLSIALFIMIIILMVMVFIMLYRFTIYLKMISQKYHKGWCYGRIY